MVGFEPATFRQKKKPGLVTTRPQTTNDVSASITMFLTLVSLVEFSLGSKMTIVHRREELIVSVRHMTCSD